MRGALRHVMTGRLGRRRAGPDRTAGRLTASALRRGDPDSGFRRRVPARPAAVAAHSGPVRLSLHARPAGNSQHEVPQRIGATEPRGTGSGAEEVPANDRERRKQDLSGNRRIWKRRISNTVEKCLVFVTKYVNFKVNIYTGAHRRISIVLKR